MVKRKLDPTLYNVRLPMPKWPRAEEPEKWSKNDFDTALMINSMHLAVSKGRTGLLKICDSKNMWQKVSLFLQALDLANFDDYDIYLDHDLEDLRARHLLVRHAAVECHAFSAPLETIVEDIAYNPVAWASML